MLLIPPNERLIAEIRKHIFYFYLQIFGLLIVAIMPLFLHLMFFEFIEFTNPVAVNALFGFAYALFLLFVWLMIFISWTDYYIDVWLITDKQVIDFELKGLFHRDIASVNLQNIVDVKVVINGMIEHILNTGDIHIQTAGADREFLIKGIRDPEHMRQVLLEAIQVQTSSQLHTIQQN